MKLKYHKRTTYTEHTSFIDSETLVKLAHLCAAYFPAMGGEINALMLERDTLIDELDDEFGYDRRPL